MSEENLKNNLHKIRNEKGVTQEDLAKKIGVTRQTIICIEKGNCSPSVSLALKISKSLNVCVDEVFEIV